MPQSDLIAFVDNFGDEFDVGVQTPGEITIQLGDGLDKTAGGAIEVVLTTTSEDIVSEEGFVASATVDAGQDSNTAGIAAISSVRADTGWTVAGTTLTYAGSPHRVELTAMVRQNDGGAGVARSSPELTLQRGGANIPGVTSASAYIRDATGHVESSNTIAFTDPTPGTNPSYSLGFAQGSGAGAVTPVVDGTFGAVAVEKTTTTVITSVTPTP